MKMWTKAGMVIAMLSVAGYVMAEHPKRNGSDSARQDVRPNNKRMLGVASYFLVTDESGLPLEGVQISWSCQDATGATPGIFDATSSSDETTLSGGANDRKKFNVKSRGYINAYDGSRIDFEFRKQGFRFARYTYTAPYREGTSSGGSVEIYARVEMRRLVER